MYRSLSMKGQALSPYQTFLVIWFGQLVSMVGTEMTQFALIVWAYQETGQATTVALLGFCMMASGVVFAPLAGVWVDRLDRRQVLFYADMSAMLVTLLLLALYSSGRLAIWHLFIAEALLGALGSFQSPAYAAMVSVLLPKAQYMRASGMRSMAHESSRILAPFLAGLMLATLGLQGVLFVDLGSAGIALLSLLLVHVPRLHEKAQNAAPRFWAELAEGWRFIRARPGLWGMMWIMGGINLCAGLAYFGVLPAMILARSGGDEQMLAAVHMALGAGGVFGGLVVSVWGGPRQQIHVMLLGCALSFLLGDFLMGVGRDLPMWVAASLATSLFIPFVVGAQYSIWQAKTPPQLLGRVLNTQSMIFKAMIALGYLLAGPLADLLLEPAMQPEGALAPYLGGLLGTGQGAGMAVIFMLTALGGCVISLSGYLLPEVREIETRLPDVDSSG